ncbi:hypothetical protein V8C35DRAFT_277365 [Trichoderma chlorosporum]
MSDIQKHGSLLQESSPRIWQEYDVVVVHGIRQTQWTAKSWKPDIEPKPSANWIRTLGLESGRLAHFHYEIDDATPSAFYVDGNEQEAQNLLDGIVQMRLEFQEYSKNRDYSVDMNLRPIIFIAHDIGGLIVKKLVYI